MVSTRRRRVGLNSDPLRRPPPSRKTHLPPVSQFVKVVLDLTMESKTLKIPPRFVKAGPKLSDTVTLETPTGFKHKIQLKRVNGEVWFQDGWSEFAERYSIRKGHLLFFDFQGDSTFGVRIFDMSATEAEYESNDEMEEGECDGSLGSQGSEEEENDTIDVLDGLVDIDVKPASASNPRSSSNKCKKNIGLTNDSDVEVIDLDKFLCNTTPSKKRNEGKSRNTRSKIAITRNTRGQTAKSLCDGADLMDIEVLEEDQIPHKQEFSLTRCRGKKLSI
ncbi:PREDICTED: B3 domain-containing protein At3g18960 [Tarenaya hassleriana]|uniref:B3 domain-containing protein At3g18960 n=1 Tax=Tarenaya hassleriana TaxID=28532 RepID=UPI00053C9A36|nr:PREDICTED: B3 domain-containing protein At3g18960 [Tarenaya hassleriana]